MNQKGKRPHRPDNLRAQDNSECRPGRNYSRLRGSMSNRQVAVAFAACSAVVLSCFAFLWAFAWAYGHFIRGWW